MQMNAPGGFALTRPFDKLRATLSQGERVRHKPLSQEERVRHKPLSQEERVRHKPLSQEERVRHKPLSPWERGWGEGADGRPGESKRHNGQPRSGGREALLGTDGTAVHPERRVSEVEGPDMDDNRRLG